MSRHPLNLVLAFSLEIALLAALIYWGWTQHDGFLRVLLTVGLPLLASVLWGVFRVDNAPGKAVVAVPGIVRLLLELVLFGSAVGLLAAAGQSTAALIFGVLLVIHYLTSWDRVRWLLANRDGHLPFP